MSPMDNALNIKSKNALDNSTKTRDSHMTLSRNHRTFLLAAAGGFLLWFYAIPLTGHREPWDGNIFAYAGALAILGLAAVCVYRGNSKSAYWGSVTGQLLFGIFPFIKCTFITWSLCDNKVGSLFPLGIILILACSLVTWAGGIVTLKLLGRSA